MFVETFNELLEDSGLNRKQFSEKCGIPYTTVMGWTKLGRLPDFVSIIKIADFFDCSTDYLLGRSTISVKNCCSDASEEKLLNNFRRLNKDNKILVLKLVDKLEK